MRVHAIADLHLSGTGEKPMDVFGPEWVEHDRRIAENWRRTVAADDLVLMPGDLSWAMTLEEAKADLVDIGALPGEKYFIRGNHDYWCTGPARVRAALPPSLHYVRFGAAVHGGVGICGVRGWIPPWHADYAPEDERHWRRAIARLELSLEALSALEWNTAVAIFHYPPRAADEGSELTHRIRDAGVSWCVYGHLHGRDAAGAFEGEAEGVTYRCVSADRLGFAPLELFSL